MTGRLHDTVAWPVHTRRLTLRPATAEDAAATWEFRRLPEVSRWLTQNTGTLTEYRDQFLDSDSLTKTLVVELDGHVIGDLMLEFRTRALRPKSPTLPEAPKATSAGSCTLTTPAMGTPPKRYASSWTSRSTSSSCAGSQPPASRRTRRHGD